MNKTKFFEIVTFIFIIFLAIILRYYKLGEAPQGLYLDEAGQGYSAYSILKTGKDEFGKSFPIVFRSFTDFKTPIYIYLIVPLIPLFGLTAFTVRFPSFFFSILTIPIIYLLINELTKKDISKKLRITVCLLVTISPWHILFGRTNFECNVALFFFLTGMLAFYKSFNSPIWLILSGVLLAIAIPAYHAQRIVTPLMILILFLRHRKILLSKTHKKYLLMGTFLGLVISLPSLSVITSPGFLARANGLNIFSHTNRLPAGFFENYKGPLSLMINSSLFLSTQEFLSLYVSYFSPRNMFILGDSGLRSSFPELATFFIWQFPLLIVGLYKMVKSKKLSELKFFTLSFLLISPIPAALTRDPYSTIRSLQMLIPLNIIIGFAIVDILNKNKIKTIVFASGLIIVLYSTLKLYSSGIILNEYYRAIEWNYGWEKVVDNIQRLNSNIPIIVDNSRDEPYIELLFFLKHDPITYQRENLDLDLSQYYSDMRINKTKKIKNIITRPINWEEDLKKEQYFIGDSLSISKQQIKEHRLTLISEIKYPNNSTAFLIVKTNP